MAKRKLEYLAQRNMQQISPALPIDLVEAIDQIATEEGTTRQTIVLWGMRDYVKKYPRLVNARELVG